MDTFNMYLFHIAIFLVEVLVSQQCEKNTPKTLYMNVSVTIAALSGRVNDLPCRQMKRRRFKRNNKVTV